MSLFLSTVLLAASSGSYQLNWWGPYICESVEETADYARALDLTVLDWSDPITLVIAGYTSIVVQDDLDIEFMVSEVELEEQSRDISETWFLEYDNSGEDDDGYSIFEYEDSSSNERYLAVGFHNVTWPPDGSTGTPSGMGILGLDISNGHSYADYIHTDEDWVQEANLWDAVHVPDLSDFASGSPEDGFAACGWYYECDPDTVQGEDPDFIHGLVWLKSLYSYPSCDVVIDYEDEEPETNIGTWGYLIYDDNGGDPLLVLSGMHGDNGELSHRLGVIDNDEDNTIFADTLGSSSGVFAYEGPVAKVATLQYVTVGNYNDNGDEALCASYWSYNTGSHEVSLEDTAIYENGSGEPLEGYCDFNVFATALSPTVPPTKLIVLISARKPQFIDEWGVLITTITLDTSTMELDTMATPTFLEIDPFPAQESEFKAFSFVWDTMAPIHGLGVGSFIGTGRICAFEIVDE
jgi:hypothetical protein